MSFGDFLKDVDSLRIQVYPDFLGAPKMQLSADCPVSPDFRVEMDAWLLEFFGRHPCINMIPDGQSYCFNGIWMVNPRTYSELKSQPNARIR